MILYEGFVPKNLGQTVSHTSMVQNLGNITRPVSTILPSMVIHWCRNVVSIGRSKMNGFDYCFFRQAEVLKLLDGMPMVCKQMNLCNEMMIELSH